MESGTRVIARLFVAALMVMAFGLCRSASAETITFDGLTAGNYNPYVEKGYQLINTGSFDPTTAQMSYGAGSADPSPTSSTLNSTAGTTTTLTKIGGGVFNLLSIDFAQAPVTFAPTPFDMTFNYVGGTSATFSYALSNATSDLVTFAFGQNNLLSVSWIPTHSPWHLQFDNITVTGQSAAVTPIPAALPLFLSGLGFLGFGAWRRRGTTAAAA